VPRPPIGAALGPRRPTTFFCAVVLVGMSASGGVCSPGREAEPPRGETWIHQETPPAGVSPALRAEFARFFAAYSERLRKRMHDRAAGGWHFWVVVTQDPRHRRQPQILVSGKAGELEVPIARFPVSGASKRVRDTVKRSVALSRDPLCAAMLSGKPSAWIHSWQAPQANSRLLLRGWIIGP